MKHLLRIYHLFFALLATFTLIFELSQSPNIVDFFSYFTILSNILVVGVFFYLGLWNFKKSHKLDSIRGATLAYILVTGLVYLFFLDNGQTNFPWEDFILHKIIPTAVIIDWLIYPPLYELKFKEFFKWLIFPLFYIAYTLVRGLIINWYPYNFLDPGLIGYKSVFMFCLIVIFVSSISSALIILTGNKLEGKEF